MRTIGLISDTHGHLPAAVHALFSGVDEILHAGDVVGHEILLELGEIAPTHAVRGNCDHGPTGHLPLFVDRTYGELGVLVVHILGPGGERVDEAVAREVTARGAGLVVHGHTHRPGVFGAGGVSYVNPGSVGNPRHGFPASLAVLTLAPTREVRILDLEGRCLEAVSV